MESDRAGDEGEYHHSRNLKKKMAVGRITLSESNKNCGDEKTNLRKNASNPAACCLTDEDAVELIRRWKGNQFNNLIVLHFAYQIIRSEPPQINPNPGQPWPVV